MDKNALAASHFSPADLARNVRCIAQILHGLPAPPRWFEFFGGFGSFTELLVHLWPGVPCELWDLDPLCYEVLIRKFPWANVRLGDSLAKGTPQPTDAVIFDFSVITYRTIQAQLPALERAFSVAPSLVTITDSGINKLHLNWKSYGLAEADEVAYFDLYGAMVRERWGYHLHRVARHGRAAYLLFLPTACSVVERTRITRSF